MIRTLIAFTTIAAANAAPVDFAEEVRPLFNKHCVGCHGGVKNASNLSFISRAQAIAEAKSGLRAIVPGKPSESELVKRVTSSDPDERMPPPDHGAALSKAEQDMLARWIEEGAEWKGHWAFEKPSRPAKTGIDSFVSKHSKPAGPSEMLRRVSLDLTGLPPSVDEMESFEKDSSDAAYAAVVDRLLESEHFGERWAAMWMDVARYADSEGMGIDSRRNVWKYRDWLIDAFNESKPFDVFVKEQLAGDLFPEPTTEQLIATTFHRLTQANNEGGTDDEEFRVMAVIDRVNTTWEAFHGVTFGCTQCHSHPYDPIQHEEYYKFMAFFNNTADADLGEGFPLMKVPLEKSHYAKAADWRQRTKMIREALYHEAEQIKAASKWHPIAFTGATSSSPTGIKVVEETEFQATGNMNKGTIFTLEFKAPKTLTAFRIDLLPSDPETARSTPEWGAVLSGITLEQQIPGTDKYTKVNLREVLADEPEPFYDPNDSLTRGSRGFGPYSKQFRNRHCVVVLENPLSLPKGSTLQLRLRHDIFALGAFPLVTKRGRVSLTDDTAWANFSTSPSIANKRKSLAYMESAEREIKSTSVPVMYERPKHLTRETHLFERGNWLEKGKAVTAEVPGSFPAIAEGKVRDRMAMAEWFVSDDNPLTSRVLVNRLWEQLFGKGLVETLEDFGSSGAKPSHPELLDYLAVRFQKDLNWDVKAILREMVLSATYRQTARVSPKAYASDPSNRLLARGPRQRLTAEMVRDHALTVSGLFSPTLHGPPVHPPIPKGVWKPFDGGDKWNTSKPDEADRYRRAIYVYMKRSIPYPMFATFDAPSGELCQQRRLPSNTPLQALTLLNDTVFDECARGLADRMTAASDQLEQQLIQGHRIATSQNPASEALAELSRLYHRLRDEEKSSAKDALGVVASVLLNLDAALTK
ncbi:MAG: hypothetical protein ACI8T1_002469 [Verrucomicrobiales bacterium]|jgi:hypothetical protein